MLKTDLTITDVIRLKDKEPIAIVALSRNKSNSIVFHYGHFMPLSLWLALGCAGLLYHNTCALNYWLVSDRLRSDYCEKRISVNVA